MANRRKRRAKEPVQGEEEGEDIVPATQFEPHESDDSQTMWDVIAILRESKTKYEVRWAGNDPATGKPWKPSWIPKEDCTNELIRDWKEQKRKLQEAKQSKKSLKRREISRSPSKVATRSSRAASLREPEKAVPLSKSKSPRIALKPVITRKRPRSSSTTEEVPPLTNSSEGESDSDSPEGQRVHKRRKVVPTSHDDGHDAMESEFQEYSMPSPIPKNSSMQSTESLPNGDSEPVQKSPQIPETDSAQANVSQPSRVHSEDSVRQTRDRSPSTSPERPRVSPILRPVPQISPTVFRERMEPPTSQIEQFSTQETPIQRSKHSTRDSACSGGDRQRELELQQEPEMENAYDVIVSRSRKHQLKPRYEGGVQQDLSPDASSPVQSSPLQSNLMDTLPFRSRSNTSFSHVAEQRANNLARMLAAKDAVISEMREVISDKETEVLSLERKVAVLQTDVREATATIRARDERITRLIEKMHESGVSGVLSSVAIGTPQQLQTSISLASPIPQVPPEKDEALISQLKVEIAQLRVEKATSDAMLAKLQQELAQERTEKVATAAQMQEEVAKARAEKAAADTMVEQARDVARRAEAAKMDLSAKERIARETAQNAPKIAEELYRKEKEMAEAEIEKYKVQLDLLQAQSRLTGDSVRQKAAEHDVLLPRYKALEARHKRMYKDMVDTENERDQLLQLMQMLKELALQIGQGTADNSTYAQLANLLERMQEIQSDEEQEEDDEDADADADADADIDVNETLPSGGEQGNTQPVVEETGQSSRAQSSSYAGPDLERSPAILIQEIDEGHTRTVASTQTDKSDAMGFMCLWHSEENETCQEYRATKQALHDHIFKGHLGS